MQHEYDAIFTDKHGTDKHGTDKHGTDKHGTDKHGTDEQGNARLLGILISFNNPSG
jgi:hypothetical protein